MEDIVLSPGQDEIVNAFPGFLLNDDTEMTISGYAGSGKTFLVQYLTTMAPAQQKMVELLDPSIKPRKFVYTATTNKAAEVLRGILNQPTSTIHRVLGLRVHDDYRTGKQVLKAHETPEPLHNSVIFVDEASMINDQLAGAIRDAIKKWDDCKLVFIGDAYQLPPVKEDICSVFREGAPNVHFLSEIQRQEEGSPIIKLASKYREMLDDPTLGWPEIPHNDETIIVYDDKEKYLEALRTAFKKPHGPDDLKILAWSNARVHKYNKWVRNLMGFTRQFESGDIVTTNKPLFLRNNTIAAPTDYRLEISTTSPGTDSISNGRFTVNGFWVQFDELGDSSIFQPADMTEVQAISRQLAKEKDWGPYFEMKRLWADLRPIHASTVHKAQGSTYREVFVDIDDIGKNTRWRDLVRLLYVAVTRASHRVHFYGNISVHHTRKTAEDTMEAFENVKQLLQR